MKRLVAWTIRAGRGRWLAIILLATVTLPVALHPYSPFARARTALFDAYQTVLPRPRVSAPVALVAIDEAALRNNGQWPWPRVRLAALIERIGEQGALAIGLDMLLPERDQSSPESLADRVGAGQESIRDALAAMPSYDALLSQTLGRFPVVLGAAGFDFAAASTSAGLRTWPVVIQGSDISQRIRGYPYVLPSLPQLQSAASGQALLSADLERGVVRRISIINAVGNAFVPTFSVELLRVAMRAHVTEVQATAEGIKFVQVGDLRIPTQASGEVWVHYGAFLPDRYVSAADVFERRIAATTFKDKVVIVALTGLGVVDYKTTARGEYVPGAEVHAQLVESFFDGRFLSRPPWMPAAEVAILVVLGWMLIWIAPHLRRDPAILTAFGLVLLVMALGFALFHWFGLLFDAVSVVIALSTVFSSLIASALVRADHDRRATERSLQTAREASARVAGELEAARRIQLGILPSSQASFPEERRFELAAAIEPARAVGGDLYDFFMLDHQRLFVLVGDVSGKGIPASLLMSITKALTKSIALRAGGNMNQVLTQANVEVSRDNPESQFVTAFAAVLEADNGSVRYWTAGHDTPFLLSRGSARQIDRALAGPPLCVLDGFEYREQSIALQPGDALILFTDGVTEAEDASGRQFGKERLANCLSALPQDLSAAAILEAVQTAVETFVGDAQASDDLALLVVRWLGVRGAANAP